MLLSIYGGQFYFEIEHHTRKEIYIWCGPFKPVVTELQMTDGCRDHRQETYDSRTTFERIE